MFVAVSCLSPTITHLDVGMFDKDKHLMRYGCVPMSTSALLQQRQGGFREVNIDGNAMSMRHDAGWVAAWLGGWLVEPAPFGGSYNRDAASTADPELYSACACYIGVI